ncbi:MAG TPA: hypothetical protein DCF46_10610 [Porphyromonadaceae bacterium]|jgi:hypothetical protein|nr:hypothetical protein [Porphyromonadaceae bacterium]
MKRNINGTFAEGNKGGGRPRGSKNQATTELRERVNDLIELNWETIQADFEQLEPGERINMTIRLLEFAIPKLQRTNVVEEHTEPMQITFVNYGKTDQDET